MKNPTPRISDRANVLERVTRCHRREVGLIHLQNRYADSRALHPDIGTLGGRASHITRAETAAVSACLPQRPEVAHPVNVAGFIPRARPNSAGAAAFRTSHAHSRVTTTSPARVVARASRRVSHGLSASQGWRRIGF